VIDEAQLHSEKQNRKWLNASVKFKPQLSTEQLCDLGTSLVNSNPPAYSERPRVPASLGYGRS
jgi:hypothetical protein